MTTFGFSISPGEPRGVAQEITGAENMDYHRVGIWDSPALFREPYVVFGASALNTTKSNGASGGSSVTTLNSRTSKLSAFKPAIRFG